MLVINNYGKLKATSILGESLYNNPTPPIHVSYSDSWCSYGKGYAGTVTYVIDITDSQRYASAPIGHRPLYFHCYKQGDYYYLQYWYFFSMNDIKDQTYWDIYHEGDWEHVSIKIEKVGVNFIPRYVNFYQHAGGHTINANNCCW